MAEFLLGYAYEPESTPEELVARSMPRRPVCVLKQRLLVRTGVSARAVVQC